MRYVVRRVSTTMPLTLYMIQTQHILNILQTMLLPVARNRLSVELKPCHRQIVIQTQCIFKSPWIFCKIFNARSLEFRKHFTWSYLVADISRVLENFCCRKKNLISCCLTTVLVILLGNLFNEPQHSFNINLWLKRSLLKNFRAKTWHGKTSKTSYKRSQILQHPAFYLSKTNTLRPYDCSSKYELVYRQNPNTTFI